MISPNMQNIRHTYKKFTIGFTVFFSLEFNFMGGGGGGEVITKSRALHAREVIIFVESSPLPSSFEKACFKIEKDWYDYAHSACYYLLLEVEFPCKPSCPSVGRLVGWLVCQSVCIIIPMLLSELLLGVVVDHLPVWHTSPWELDYLALNIKWVIQGL